ncbi:Mu transposase C-terminal domain-containing protein [Kitasatospora aureofaciens]|uniref:Mu transposase C-terminal domain-containing protein n=1 Tax=Kitasatospora aureofaciens TaxID=1894 RepID=UPI0033AB1F1B
MLDTTRLDIMVVFDQGVVGRPELTIALDVATRSILAAVLRPASTKAVDAALLLAEMAVPHPMRPGWPKVLELSHAAVPYERLLALDARLEGAAARPVIVPETVVVDRGKVFVSEAFLAACETLGVSVQSAPPRQPAAKGPVERTFGSINTLLCQYVAGYTGSHVTRRGRDVASQARWTLPQLQDLLDEWITTGWQNRPHEGLRHPMMPRACLSPNEMWGALVAACGYLPVPLTGDDYTELLPVVWKAVTDRGIRVDHRTYDHAALNPHRGHPSPVTAQSGKWEVHHNPHDLRQVWIRLPDGKLTEIPWIHRDHASSPFNDHIWQYLKTQVARRPDRDHYEAALVRALDDLLLRARTANTNSNERSRTARHITATARPADALDTTTAIATMEAGAASGTDPGRRDARRGEGLGSVPRQAVGVRESERDDGSSPWQPWAESLDDEETDTDMDELGGAGPETGFPLYNARLEAEQW